MAILTLTYTPLTNTGCNDATKINQNYADIKALFATMPDGSGTADTIPKWTDSDTLGDSNITDTGSVITLGSATTVSGALTLSTVAADTDNTVLIIKSGVVKSDEIDSRVWGSSLVDGSGTATYIPKWSDSATLTDSSMTDDGTSIRTGRANLYIQAGASTDANLFFEISGVGTGGLTLEGGASGTGALLMLPVSDGTLFPDNNVGIGVLFSTASPGYTAPQSSLHIYEDSAGVITSADGAQVIIEQDGAGDCGIQFELTGGQVWGVGIDNSNADRFTFRDITSGVTRMVLENGATGGVLIGNYTSATGDLNVVEGGSNCGIYFDTYSATAADQSLILLRKSASDTIGTFAETADNEDLGELRYYGTNTGSGAGFAASVFVEQDGASGATYVPARMSLQTSDGSATPATRVRIDSAGDVGINQTVLSNARLEILDASKAQQRLTHTNGVDYVDFTVDSNSGLLIENGNSGVNATMGFKLGAAAGAERFFVLDSAGQIQFYVSSSGAGHFESSLDIGNGSGTGTLTVRNTSTQLGLEYGAGVSTTVAVDSGGDATVTPSGNHFVIASGKDLRLGNARQAGDPATDGFILVEDSTGTQYKIPCLAA